MKHLRTLTKIPAPAQFSDPSTGIDGLEQIILLLFSVFFNDWDNFSSVYQNLQKFYRKI